MLQAQSANQAALGEAFNKMRHVRLDGHLYIAVSDLFAGLSGKTVADVNHILNQQYIASKPAVVRLTSRLHKFAGRGQKPIPV
eukprot:3740612-Rhodomonas_salina.1